MCKCSVNNVLINGLCPKGECMVTNHRKVNWFNEGLNEFYGDDNNGLIHGVYSYEDDDFPYDVAWFKTETEQQNYLNDFLRENL